MSKVQYNPTDKLAFNKRQAQTGQYDAPTPLSGEIWITYVNK